MAFPREARGGRKLKITFFNKMAFPTATNHPNGEGFATRGWGRAYIEEDEKREDGKG